MFKKLSALILVLAVLVAYASYRVVSAQSRLSNAPWPSSSLNLPPGYVHYAQPLKAPIRSPSSARQVMDSGNLLSGNAAGAWKAKLDGGDCYRLKSNKYGGSNTLAAIC